MNIAPFKLERLFDKYEFSVKYLLSLSDCEPLSQSEITDLMDREDRSKWEKLSFGYTETPGGPELRRIISEISYGEIAKDELVVAAPEELIFLTLNALLNKEDHVIVIHPHYQSLSEIPKAIGCEVSNWSMKNVDQTWRIDLEQLEQLIKGNTKLIIVNFPHNPTGFVPTPKEVELLVQLCEKKDIYLFSDEMYKGLEYGQQIHSMVTLYERGISLSGLSKTYACPGLRIGWVALRDKNLRNKILGLKDYTTICNSAPSEFFAEVVLKNNKMIIERNLKIIQANKKVWKSFANKFSAVFSSNSDSGGGSTLFPRLSDQIHFESFFQTLLDRYQVMIVGGDVFDYDSQYFRVGLGRKNFPVILKTIEPYLKELCS